MKCQDVFSMKNEKKNKVLSVAAAIGASKVNYESDSCFLYSCGAVCIFLYFQSYRSKHKRFRRKLRIMQKSKRGVGKKYKRS